MWESLSAIILVCEMAVKHYMVYSEAFHVKHRMPTLVLIVSKTYWILVWDLICSLWIRLRQKHHLYRFRSWCKAIWHEEDTLFGVWRVQSSRYLKYASAVGEDAAIDRDWCEMIWARWTDSAGTDLVCKVQKKNILLPENGIFIRFRCHQGNNLAWQSTEYGH